MNFSFVLQASEQKSSDCYKQHRQQHHLQVCSCSTSWQAAARMCSCVQFDNIDLKWRIETEKQYKTHTQIFS